MDDDSNRQREYLNHILHQSIGSWESSKITTYCDGNWIIFTDSPSKKRLNSPRLSKKITMRIPYRHKEHNECPMTSNEELIISCVKKDNYLNFRPRKYIYHSQSTKSERTLMAQSSDNLFQSVSNYPIKSFHGDDPHRNPFRRSNILLQHEREIKIHPPSKSSSHSFQRTARQQEQIFQSLYERSLKKKE